MITSEEGQFLEKQVQEKMQSIMDDLVVEQLNRSCVFLRLDENNLVGNLTNQTLIKDGSTKVWIWQAGLQATRDPPRRVSPLKMKASASEENLRFAVDTFSRCLGDSDVGLFLSGKNLHVWQAIRKELSQLKPRPAMRELSLDVDEQQLVKRIRLGSRIGSVETSETYMMIMKNSKSFAKLRSGPRRFCGGNSAFKRMSNAPILEKSAMARASVDERERLFRGVVASDKWAPNKSNEEEDDEEEDDADATVAIPAGDVVLFHMEHHPKVQNPQQIES